MGTSVVILLSLVSILGGSFSVSSTECPVKPLRGIDFSMSNRRNHTGHWNTLVHLRRGGNLDNKERPEFGSYDVDVKQVAEKCGDSDYVDVFLSITAPTLQAGPGYELVPGLGYYKLHTTPKSWPEARQICSEEGGHLAILNSDKEVESLKGIFSLYPKIQEGWQNLYAHVGFHDLYEEGKFITIFGDSLQTAGYSKFAPGQPDQGRDANCGCMERTGGLHDVHCTASLAFFCEQELL